MREKTQAELEIGARFSKRLNHLKACIALREDIMLIPAMAEIWGQRAIIEVVDDLIASLDYDFDAAAILADLEAHI